MYRKKFSPGDIIFQQGDKTDEAYWILSGKVEISIETPSGRDILTTLYEGEIFGEMGMIDDKPRTATATVIAPTEVEVINETDFLEHVVRKEDRLMRYLSSVFDRLRTTDALLHSQLGKRWTETRLASGPPADRVTEEIPALTILSTEASGPLYPDGLKLTAARFPFRIGRRNDDGCLLSPMDLPLWDQQRPYVVSRSHCRIECKGGGYFVRDLGSLHGTIVNGESIGAEHPNLTAPLKLGENTITIGPAGSQHQYWIMVN